MSTGPTELTDADASLFSIIASDPRVIIPGDEILIGTDGSLASLESAGLVTLYAWDGVPSVSLTPLAAEHVGLQVAAGDGYFWEPANDSDSPIRLAQRQDRIGLEDYADPAQPEPIDTMAAAEAVDRHLARLAKRRVGNRPSDVERDPDSQPRPTVLLSGCRSWTNPVAIPGEPCRACLKRPLGRHTFCLLCDRWGLDAIFARWWAAARARAKVAAAPKAKRPKFKPRIKGAKVRVAASA